MSHETESVSRTREVRAALRAELESRGLEVASDTLGARGELYILGENDLARAFFEFKSTAVEAIETMYQGSWVEGLPPRFAVLPSDQAVDSSIEILEQMRVIPLRYELSEGVTFPDLDLLLAENLAR